MHAIAVLGYLLKLKRGLSIDKISMSYLFSFLRYYTKCVIKFLFRQLTTSKTKIYLGSSSKAMADKEKKEEYGNTKIRISRERKELFSRNKNYFS